MMITSYSADVADDGEPTTSLNIGGEALRDFNHRTLDRMRIGKPGWEFVSDAYRALGEMSGLVGRLPQACEQIARALQAQLDDDLIVIDPGTRYDGYPERAVAAALAALDQARSATTSMYSGISEAQNAINAAAYAGSFC